MALDEFVDEFYLDHPDKIAQQRRLNVILPSRSAQMKKPATLERDGTFTAPMVTVQFATGCLPPLPLRSVALRAREPLQG